jgi:hypothetical protein
MLIVHMTQSYSDLVIIYSSTGLFLLLITIISFQENIVRDYNKKITREAFKWRIVWQKGLQNYKLFLIIENYQALELEARVQLVVIAGIIQKWDNNDRDNIRIQTERKH